MYLDVFSWAIYFNGQKVKVINGTFDMMVVEVSRLSRQFPNVSITVKEVI